MVVMDGNHFLSSLISQFEYYKVLGESTMKQLNEQQLLQEPHQGGNSIGIIVNHLHGNMMSRWTDFLSSDGEKSWRMRDREFEAEIGDKKQLMYKWDQGWACLFNALNALTPEDINAEILIRNQKHRVYEAIHRQLAHYASHIGQIVLIEA